MTISQSTATTKSNLLDGRSIQQINFIGDEQLVSRDAIMQISSVALTNIKSNGISEIKSLEIIGIDESKLPKWTENYNVEIEQSTKWIKVNGISSPNVPIPISIGNGDSPAKASFSELGIMTNPVSQTSDSGAASKTVVSGLTPSTVEIISGANSDAGWSGGVVFACMSPMGYRKMVFLPNGQIYFIISSLYGAYTKNKILLFRSLDGGVTWALILLDESEDKRQVEPCITVDKYATLHIVWREYTSGDAARNHVRYCRYYTTSGIQSGILQVDDTTSYNRTPHVCIKSDGLTAAVTWCGQGYGTDILGYNILYCEITPAGAAGDVNTITTDADHTAGPGYSTASTEFDENGYRHIVYGATYAGFAKPDLYYIRETVAGLQPRERLNDEDTQQISDWSNTIVYKNSIYVAYTINNDEAIAIVKATDGVAGSKVIIDSTADGAGGSAPVLMFTSDRVMYCMYTSYSATPADYIAYRVIDRELNLGTKTIYITAGAGRYLTTPLLSFGSNVMPWGYNVGIFHQYPLVCYMDMTAATMKDGILYLSSDPNCIIGDLNLPSRQTYTSYNIRGAINRSKFNSAFTPIIT